MKISEQAIVALGNLITGNNQFSPYKSGPKLVDFFNQFGENDTYGQGFPSRHVYVEDKIQKANGSSKIEKIIIAAIDPRNFLGTPFEVEKAVAYLNQFLLYDGYEVVKDGIHYQLQRLPSAANAQTQNSKVKNIILLPTDPSRKLF